MYAIIDRVMSLVRKAVPTFYRYSIDEGFCDLSGLFNFQSSISRSAEGRNNLQSSIFRSSSARLLPTGRKNFQSLNSWGEDLSAFIWKATRMPVSIGIAPKKTLAKMASHYTKHYKGYNH